MTRLERIQRLSREELTWRARTATRIHRDRLSAAWRPMAWDRRRLIDVLDVAVLDSSLRSAIDAGDWAAVHDSLLARLRRRVSRFMLDPAKAGEFCSAIQRRWPQAAEDATAQADEIVNGRYTILGYRDVNFANGNRALDWHYDPIHDARAPQRFWADVPYLDAACGDHKVIWEINRQQHWLCLGRAYWLTLDARYADTIVSQLYDWLDANPPLTGINWASMLELGFRSISWTYGLHFLLAHGGTPSAASQHPWLVDMLVGLDRQLTHVEHNLSRYFSPNTHLTGEALALYVVGRALPELAASGRWTAIGRRILLDEIDAQILPDGGHAERSLHYHRYTLDFYLCALLMAERTGDLVAMGSFRDAVARVAHFARTLADDEGRFATIGDDDGGKLWPFSRRRSHDVRDSLSLAAVVLNDPGLAPWDTPEETCWMLGAIPGDTPSAVRARTPREESALFPESGYAVVRDQGGDHLIFDVGRHGFLNGGHAHADALSLTLSLAGRPLLIDPGTATYSVNATLRDHFRSSASHNTLVVDGASSSEPAGPFHWHRRTDAQSTAWRASSRFAWAEGHHDGYPGLRHRRSVVHAAGAGWFVVDEIFGHQTDPSLRTRQANRASHHVDVNWHFDPAWQVSCAAKTLLRAVHDDGRTAWLAHDDGGLSLLYGDDETPSGWCAPEYGLLVPMWSARISHSVVLPAVLVTWIGTVDSGGDEAAPVLTRPRVDTDPGNVACAAQITFRDRSETVLLRPGDVSGGDGHSAGVSHYRTDARLLHVTAGRDGRHSVAIADGSQATASQRDRLSITCDRRVDDLYVLVDGDVIDVAASAPLPQVTIEGDAAAAARLVRVNGRERPLVRDGRTGAVIVAERAGSAPPGPGAKVRGAGTRPAEERARCVA